MGLHFGGCRGRWDNFAPIPIGLHATPDHALGRSPARNRQAETQARVRKAQITRPLMLNSCCDVDNGDLCRENPKPISKMPIAASQIAMPSNEQDFERACAVLFRCVLNDPNTQTNAVRGQGQDGVDIFGFRNEDHTRPVGIQCKLKTSSSRLTEKEVRAEIQKALSFIPPWSAP